MRWCKIGATATPRYRGTPYRERHELHNDVISGSGRLEAFLSTDSNADMGLLYKPASFTASSSVHVTRTSMLDGRNAVPGSW